MEVYRENAVTAKVQAARALKTQSWFLDQCFDPTVFIRVKMPNAVFGPLKINVTLVDS